MSASRGRNSKLPSRLRRLKDAILSLPLPQPYVGLMTQNCVEAIVIRNLEWLTKLGVLNFVRREEGEGRTVQHAFCNFFKVSRFGGLRGWPDFLIETRYLFY